MSVLEYSPQIVSAFLVALGVTSLLLSRSLIGIKHAMINIVSGLVLVLADIDNKSETSGDGTPFALGLICICVCWVSISSALAFRRKQHIGKDSTTASTELKN